MERLAKTIEWPSIEEGEVRWLRLEADFDGVEGVFDDFANDAGGLESISEGEIGGWGRR